jgi:cbb3-type cytochrome oxidase maturation protein
MIAVITPEKQLLVTWIVFSAVAFVGVAAAFVWAVRSGQFGQQDRARGLPLESGIPEKSISRELHVRADARRSELREEKNE